MPRNDSPLSRGQRLKAGVIANVAYPLLWGLGATLSWEVEGLSHLDGIVSSGRQPVMVFWHGRILSATLYFRHRGIVVMTSENFDGEWIARIIERFGYGTARGSTSRGGQRALRVLIRAMRRGHAAGFAVDGPRGPAGVAQPGALWLARATGNPVVPFHAEATAAWTLGSWDRTQIPHPFSRVAVVVGEPLEVEASSGASGLEAARLDLEARLKHLEARALKLLGATGGSAASRDKV
jgi:lysophospholipid acyltransferase (LPLAT)-like uncharacterized protein